MTTARSMYNLLIEDTTARLIAELVTGVSDDSKVVLVSSGSVKHLPTDNRIRIAVKWGNEQWKHTLNVPSQNVGMNAPIGTIGGSLNWRERFVAEIDLYFAASVNQAAARTIAGVIMSRARWALQNKDLDGTWWFTIDADDFGEKASSVQVMDAYLIEGGSELKWTWRGEIHFEFLTENEGCV